MPELPEVETIRRGLAARLVGATIQTVDSSDKALRKPSTTPLARLAGRRVVAFSRHAKRLTWELDDGSALDSHLGMTGKWLFAEEGTQRPPHTHLTLTFDGGTILWFADARRFGWLDLKPADAGPRTTVGMDALDAAFTTAALEPLLASSRAPLKAFLLDQSKVGGLGNIYACEALWRARLSPRRKACNTPKNRIAPLRDAMVAVLEDSLAAGGTSFNDYVDSLGQQGSFLFSVGVFQKEGSPCPRCATTIQRIIQSGRSTFYCPTCQR